MLQTSLLRRTSKFVLCLITALGGPGISATAAAEFKGKMVVLHGDTLQQDKLHIHLQGLVSPPRGAICHDKSSDQHACGDAAANALQSIIGGGQVRCLGTEFNHEGHLRAMCYIGTKNLNGTMVRAGWALSEGRYGRWHESLEAKAKDAGSGLWADGSGDPWQWNW